MLAYNYLSNGKHKAKINDSCSSCSEILFGVPEGSTLRPLLFTVFIRDMVCFMEGFEIAYYADNSNPFSVKLNPKSVFGERDFIFSFIYMASEKLYEDQYWQEPSFAICQL